MKEALDIQVKGIVQGVGFRPFVYRMAKRYLISGWVLNTTEGVFIHAESDEKLLDEFVIELSENAPAAADVKEIDMKEVPLTGIEGFEIRFSDDTSAEETTLVSPDLATCDECLAEVSDPENRRYGYPFINCTNCGPRFTIIDKLPYDRPNTSMKKFTMCDACETEYHDPVDRRFHAQPNACFTCGPALIWRESDGDKAFPSAGTTAGGTGDPSLHVISSGASDSERSREIPAHMPEETSAMITQAAQWLADGKILAVKDLGGYHLVCDASNANTVAELRERKHRDGKPFAVMMRSIDEMTRWCAVNADEARLLESPQRPIVLLRKLQGRAFRKGVADHLSEVGIMLPCTALQKLLIDRFAEVVGDDAPVLVMTSGNVHDEPICISSEEAYEKLSGIADAFLSNDRPILARFDDSVARIIATGEDRHAVQFIRRSRGYAPAPCVISSKRSESRNLSPQPASGPSHVISSGGPKGRSREISPILFATGAEQKNTFTLLRGTEAFVSQHIGDVENADTYDAWLATKDRYETLFEAMPTAVACDMHPEYLTSKWAHAQNLPVTTVQHHHAHIASVMAEHHLHDAVCGIAFDGTGYGPDGAIWGGEVLLANESAFERFANFAYVPMPGGAACIKHPLRMAYGVLWAYDLLEHPGAQRLLNQLGDQAGVCDTMIDQGINAPMTSSVGRLFDAASALLGICTEASYEGEPAILLEAAAATSMEPIVSTLFTEMQQGDGSPVATSAGAGPRTTEDSIPSPHVISSGGPEGRSREISPQPANAYRIDVIKNTAGPSSTAQDTSVLLFDAAPLFGALLDDIANDVDPAASARRFHGAIIDAILTAATLVRELYGIETVALSGGVFMNRLLMEHTLPQLEEHGFTVAINRDLPPNDGCISLGQAVIAWAQKTDGRNRD